jgi:hypothetical protein
VVKYTENKGFTFAEMPTSDLSPLREKEKVNLTCEARGYPEPQVRYVKGIVTRH